MISTAVTIFDWIGDTFSTIVNLEFPNGNSVIKYGSIILFLFLLRFAIRFIKFLASNENISKVKGGKDA